MAKKKTKKPELRTFLLASYLSEDEDGTLTALKIHSEFISDNMEEVLEWAKNYTCEVIEQSGEEEVELFLIERKGSVFVHKTVEVGTIGVSL